jgi:hypothetical protein
MALRKGDAVTTRAAHCWFCWPPPSRCRFCPLWRRVRLSVAMKKSPLVARCRSPFLAS